MDRPPPHRARRWWVATAHATRTGGDRPAFQTSGASLFDDHDVSFATIYQNGLVERPIGRSWDKLGGKVEAPETGIGELAQNP